MNYAVMSRIDVEPKFSPEKGLHFTQEVQLVCDAVTWYLRLPLMYWAAYSTASNTLLDTFTCDAVELPSQSELDRVDTLWKRLANQPEMDQEQFLEPEYVKGL